MSFICLAIKESYSIAKAFQEKQISPETNHWSSEDVKDIFLIFWKLFLTCESGQPACDQSRSQSPHAFWSAPRHGALE